MVFVHRPDASSAWLAACFLLMGCAGEQTLHTKSPVESAQSTADTALEAQEKPTPSELAVRLRTHVEVLASDTYLGRGTLEKGDLLTRAYVADAFAAAGLEPIEGQASFQVPFTVYRRAYDPETTRVELTSPIPLTLELGQDMVPFDFSDDGVVEAEVVFAGYGIQSEEHGWDDYKGLDVAGRIVLVLRHEPGELDPKSSFNGANLTDHSFFETKARLARKLGARGMLLVTDAHHEEDAEDLRPNLGLTLNALGDESAEEESSPFLAAQISRTQGGALIQSTFGVGLVELQRQLDDGATRPELLRKVQKEPVRGAFSVARDESAGTPVEVFNVLGMLKGTDPDLRDELIVIGAHHDHLGAFEGAGDTIFNGADDNASGTAGVLELARVFAEMPLERRPKRSLVFVTFGAEEHGLYGSTALLRDERLPVDRIVFMLNMDMIGRAETADASVKVIGDGFVRDLRPLLESLHAGLDRMELELDFFGTRYVGNSDHHPFFERGIPFVHLFTGLHDDYHQLSDHADLLDYPRMESIIRLSASLIEEVGGAAERPVFVHHLDWLGVAVWEEPALSSAILGSVEKDSLGELVGLQAGDRVLGLDDVLLEAPRDAGPRLSEVKPGRETRILIEREGQRMTLAVERTRVGFLGIHPAAVDEETRRILGLRPEEGVRVKKVVAWSPASSAGLKAKDVLVRIEGLSVGTDTLSKRLTTLGGGETVTIEFWRDGVLHDLELTLGTRDD